MNPIVFPLLSHDYPILINSWAILNRMKPYIEIMQKPYESDFIPMIRHPSSHFL